MLPTQYLLKHTAKHVGFTSLAAAQLSIPEGLGPSLLLGPKGSPKFGLIFLKPPSLLKLLFVPSSCQAFISSRMLGLGHGAWVCPQPCPPAVATWSRETSAVVNRSRCSLWGLHSRATCPLTQVSLGISMNQHGHGTWKDSPNATPLSQPPLTWHLLLTEPGVLPWVLEWHLDTAQVGKV